MKYVTIQNIESVVYKVKGSKFFGYAYFIESEDDFKEKLNKVKQQHLKATHHCFAYRIGFDDNLFRAFDDGEPSGTAGKPILQQIDSFNLKNVLIIVVRYFGGTKLGTSGLITAYKNCALETITCTKVIEKYFYKNLKFTCNYVTINEVYKILINPIKILNSNIDIKSEFEVAIPIDMLENILLQLNEIGVKIKDN